MRFLPALLFLCLLSGAARAGDVTWDGGGDKTNWWDRFNWDGDAVPGAADDVFILNTNKVVYLTNAATIHNLTISNATLQSWITNYCIQAADITVKTNGVIGHRANSSNILYTLEISCSNLAVEAGGKLDASDAGYAGGGANAAGKGPGAGLGGYGGGGGGAAHAGAGGMGGNSGSPFVAEYNTNTYGVTTNPVTPGSGGYGSAWSEVGWPGGGYVRLEVSGTVQVAGGILANGKGSTATGQRGGGGSGGGILIRTGVLSGDGIIAANGGAAGGSANDFGGAGGGGRVAVYATTNSFTGTLSAHRGVGPTVWSAGGLGTVHCPGYVFPSNIVSGGGEWTGATGCQSRVTMSNYFLRFGDAPTLTFSNLVLRGSAILDFNTNSSVTITNASLSLDSSTLYLPPSVTVGLTNSLTLTASSLYFGSNSTANLYFAPGSYRIASNALVIQGGVVLTNQSRIYLYPGSYLECSGDISLGSTSVVYSYSHPTSGVTPREIKASNLYVAAGCALSALGGGYAGGTNTALPGKGPGGGGSSGGGGGAGGAHGGQGGAGGNGGAGVNTNTYDFAVTNPVQAGSGGGYGAWTGPGGAGGGYLALNIANLVQNDGTVTVSGATCPAGGGGGGAGGSLYISARTVSGTGPFNATGGNGHSPNGGGGGGGRIALYYVNDSGSYSATNGTGWTGGSATTGSIYRCLMPGYVSLTVYGDPAIHGTSTPCGYGATGLTSGAPLTVTVNSPADESNSVRYACFGWAGTGEVPASGTSNTVSFTIVSNSTLTWKWTNQYLLATTAGAHGYLSPDRTGWYTSQVAVLVTATASGGYHFLEWIGDVAFTDRTSNPLSVGMTQPKGVQALFASDSGSTRTWLGGTNYWTNAANWSGAELPGDQDFVLITNGVVILNHPWAVGGLAITNATLVFRGWSTLLTVYGDVSIGPGGNITHAANTTGEEHCVRLACSNLTIQGGGKMDVNYVGYAGGAGTGNGQGPGGGTRSGNNCASGGAYGGLGGKGGDSWVNTNSYGVSTNPATLGSGGGASAWSNPGGNGGGYMQLTVSRQLTVNGPISANGSNYLSGNGGGGGAGGGILIWAQTIAGSNTITANGGNGSPNATDYGGGGGGGRIAIYAETNLLTGQIPSANRGSSAAAGYGCLGTIHFPCYAFPSNIVSGGGNWSAVSNGSAVMALSNYYLRLADSSPLTISNLALAGSAIADFSTNTAMTISNASLSVDNSTLYLPPGITIALTNSLTVNNTGCLYFAASASNTPSNTLSIHGDLSLANNSRLYLYAQSALSCDGNLYLSSTSSIYSYSHPTSGVTPRAIRAANVYVPANCSITAAGGGYAGAQAAGAGKGPGGGYTGGGGGGGGGAHGGRGGGGGNGGAAANTNTYGSLTNPATAGSGGGWGAWTGPGGAGGGYVGLTIVGLVQNDGTISANGASSTAGGGGGGSGGSVCISAWTMGGVGSITATGGNGQGANGGGAGGGRIAVWCRYNHFYGTCSVTNGTGWQNGVEGTLYWRIRGPGTMFYVR